jgi:hypothetical protein
MPHCWKTNTNNTDRSLCVRTKCDDYPRCFPLIEGNEKEKITRGDEAEIVTWYNLLLNGSVQDGNMAIQNLYRLGAKKEIIAITRNPSYSGYLKKMALDYLSKM